MDFSKFFQSSYWFDPTPESQTIFVLILAIIFFILLLLGLIGSSCLNKLSKTTPPYKYLSDKIYSWSLTCSIIGLALVFFHWQEIPYLSSQILFLILFLIILFWAIIIIIYIFKKLTTELENHQHKIRLEKYLPKTKKVKK